MSAHYIRDGSRCYLSSTLRKELYITDGMLYKEPKVKLTFVKKSYYPTFVSIDFNLQQVRFKEPSHSSARQTKNEFKGKKDIDFRDMIDCKLLEAGEFKQNQEAPPFAFRFIVRTQNRYYIFYSISETERSIWLESFNRIKDG